MPPLVLIPLIWIGIVSGRQLEFVQAIWRHGDRAPISKPYPNDKYGEEAWPRGWAQLTNLGIGQAHELGTYFRERYKGFVKDAFDDDEVYIRSSDTDRALTTAQAFVTGLYPAKNKYQWKAGYSWQPIPIHSSTPGEVDLYCKASKLKCPVLERIVEKDNKADEEVYNVLYKDYFAFLGNHTGVPNFQYKDVRRVNDISREIANNLKQEPWVTKRWPQFENKTTLEIASKLRATRMLTEFGGQEKGAFRGGFLLNVWIENALAVAKGSRKPPTKMALFSSHDNVIVAFMGSWGVGDTVIPPYAACFIMEVYSDNGKYYVELFYRNSTTVEPYKLTIPNCQEPCLVQRLPLLYKDVAMKSVDDVYKKCGVQLHNSALIHLPISGMILIISYLI